MTPATIINDARSEGVALALSASGSIKATGDQDNVNKWLPAIREHKISIIALLSEAANDIEQAVDSLACYTAIASERGLTHPNPNDRHTCRQCSNYTSSGMCEVACPGGLVSAQKGYRPGAMFQEEPHRCEAFNERAI